jgi:hypothetical protein
MRPDYRILSWYLFFGTLGLLPFSWLQELPKDPEAPQRRIHFSNPHAMGRLSHRFHRWTLRVARERKRNIRESRLGMLLPLQGAAGSGASSIQVPPGTGNIAHYLTIYNNLGYNFQLMDGVYNEDLTAWPASSSLISFTGPSLPPFKTGGPITPGGAIINITKLPASANANVLVQCLFSMVSITGPGVIAGGGTATVAFLNGTSNTVVYFDRVLFYDLSAPVALNSGDDIRAVGCFFKQSSSPPARLDMGFLGCTGTLRLIGNNVNFIGGTATPNVWCGFAGYTSGAGTTWWLEDNQINDDDLANTGVDALVDFESSGTLSTLHYTRNILFNSKMYCLSVSTVWAVDNVYRSTTNALASSQGMFQIQSKTPNTTPPNAGTHYFEGNTFIQDAGLTGSTWIPAVTMSMRYDRSIGSLYIRRNKFFCNQVTTAAFAGQTIATILVRSNTAGQTIGLVDISDNEFGFTTSTGTKQPVISVRNDSGGTITRVRIRRNTAMGATNASGTYAPATVSAAAANLVTFTSTPTIGVVDLLDNDVTDGAFTGTSKIVVGPITGTRNYRGNYPREANDTIVYPGTGNPYTHGTTNLVTLTAPAQGPSDVQIVGGTITSITKNGVAIANEAAPFGEYTIQCMVGDVLVVTSSGSPTMRTITPTSGL